MSEPRQRFSRRKLSTRTLGVGLAAATVSRASAASRISTAARHEASTDDPLAADFVHTLYRRIRFGANGSSVYWWLRGTRYGLVDNVLTPFFDMHVGSIHRRRDLDAERYEISTAAAIYYSRGRCERPARTLGQPGHRPQRALRVRRTAHRDGDLLGCAADRSLNPNRPACAPSARTSSVRRDATPAVSGSTRRPTCGSIAAHVRR
jgi:hypothetical protein